MASHDEATRDAFGALVTARWALLGVLLPVAIVQYQWPRVLGLQMANLFPLAALGVIALGGVLNAYVAIKNRRRAAPWGNRVAGIHVLADVVGLTAFLALSGASANPFTMLYFLPITLATQISRAFTWSAALASMVGFGTLFLVPPDPRHAHHQEMMTGHLAGMWVALVLCGALVTFFVHRIASDLASQQEELHRLRQAERDAHQVAALGSIAAAAAHELGTPLSTIQMLSEELPSMKEEEQDDALQKIASELKRCKEIVDDMENPEVAARSADSGSPWPIADLGRHVPPSLPGIQESVIVTCEPGAEHLSTQPEAAIARVLREAVANAADACRAKGPGESTRIEVSVGSTRERATVRVSDTGVGLSGESEGGAFEPFFSTKANGRGLGLYLARVHLGQLGGTIKLRSRAQGGAHLEFDFPLLRPIHRKAP